MAKIKATPSLPKASMLQAPVSSGSSIKKSSMSGSNGVTKKVMSMSSKGKSGMKGKNPYC